MKTTQKIFDFSNEIISVAALTVWAAEDIVIFSMPTIESPNNTPEEWHNFLMKCSYLSLVQNGSVLLAASHAHQSGEHTHEVLTQYVAKEKKPYRVPIRLTQLKLGLFEHWLSASGASVHSSSSIEPHGLTAQTLIAFIKTINSKSWVVDPIHLPLMSPDEHTQPSHALMVIDDQIRFIENPDDEKGVWDVVFHRICGIPLITWFKKGRKVQGVLNRSDQMILAQDEQLSMDQIMAAKKSFTPTSAQNSWGII